MIVLLDTNVIISALLSPEGNPAKIVQLWEADEFELATSPILLQEIERALTYERVRTRLKLSENELKTFLRKFRTSTVNVEPPATLDLIKKDPADNRVLECALAARAAYLVTGDEHLLELKEYQGIVILPPAGFLLVLEIGK
jgi:putative PIN family toxin of toxin-antitoxin system